MAGVNGSCFMERIKMKEKIKDFNIIDWIVAGFLLVFCFFAYQHVDIRWTGGVSIGYLNGHILDFYDYNTLKIGPVNYLPTTYIIFALWNIPVRVLGLITDSTLNAVAFVRMWYQLLTSIFYFGTAYYLYKICREMKIGKKAAIICAFLFITNPIGIYSQFIFGQYDIFTAFFMVLGLYFYIKGMDWKFVAAFAVALTCKYFSLLFFIPLLLLREKKVGEIIKKLLGVVLLFIIETLIYLPSQGFREGVFGFEATGYIFDLVWDENFVQVSLVIVVWVLLCGIAYFLEINDNETEWAIYLSNIVTFISFGMAFWHPQWLLIAVPFWTLGTFISKKIDIFLILDVLLMLFFTVLVVNVWRDAGDQSLFSGGILVKFFDVSLLGQNLTMSDLFVIKDTNLLYSCFVAILLVYTLFKHPKLMCNTEELSLDRFKYNGIMRFRYLAGILFFVVPSIVCLYVNCTKPTVVYNVDQDGAKVLEGGANAIYEQEISEIDAEKVTGISLLIGTWERINDCQLEIEFVEKDTNIILTQATVDAEKFADCEYNKIDFDEPVKIREEKTYVVRLYYKDVNEDQSNIIALFGVDRVNKNNHVMQNGIEQDYAIVMKVIGK